jgi:hypothetical protein
MEALALLGDTDADALRDHGRECVILGKPEACSATEIDAIVVTVHSQRLC